MWVNWRVVFVSHAAKAEPRNASCRNLNVRLGGGGAFAGRCVHCCVEYRKHWIKDDAWICDSYRYKDDQAVAARQQALLQAERDGLITRVSTLTLDLENSERLRDELGACAKVGPLHSKSMPAVSPGCAS